MHQGVYITCQLGRAPYIGALDVRDGDVAGLGHAEEFAELVGLILISVGIHGFCYNGQGAG